jgi:hypothetical protein
MKAIKSKRMRTIGLFVVLIALMTSYYFNGVKVKPNIPGSRETDKIYNDISNTKKIQVDVSVKSLDLLRKLLSSRLDSQGAIKLNSEERSGYGYYIYEVDSQNISILLSSLAEIGTITSKVEKVNTEAIEFDLEGRLKDREAIYQKEFQDYNNSKLRTSYQLDRLKQLRYELDSLKYAITNQKYKAMTLLYIKAMQSDSRVGKVRNYQKFVFDFIKYLVIFTIIIAFLNYGTILLVYVMSMLGIKFPSLSSLFGKGYNYYSGYRGYRRYGGYNRYGYGSNKKRRTKRIYKHKQASEENPSEEETN